MIRMSQGGDNSSKAEREFNEAKRQLHENYCDYRN
jgi:hypothetical protein